MKENVGGKSFEEECPGGGGSASRSSRSDRGWARFWQTLHAVPAPRRVEQAPTKSPLSFLAL